MMGAPPSALPPIPPNSLHSNEHDNISVASKVGNSQSTMAMSSLLPSPSVETISEWTADGRKTMHNRSISEPDFGRSPKQVNPSSEFSTNMHSKSSVASSRFGLFGSHIFRKTIGWMSKSRQAKLGERNKFYYDEKLKRWVEEGAELPAEEVALPPPPTIASFPNHVPEYNVNNVFATENPSSNGMLETKISNSTEHSPGIPPMPPTQNQFSARGRMGVRSRYVDTFNKGGGMPTASFQSPSTPSVKPVGGAKFFVPSPVSSSEPTADSTESTQEAAGTEDTSTSIMKESSLSPFSSSSFTRQRFPSMDNISSTRSNGLRTPSENGIGSLSSRTRAASWSGSYSDALSHRTTNMQPVGDGLGVPSHLTSISPSPVHPITGLMHSNGSSYGDDLHEVEL
uniref:COPII coat assembly protein SEC16 n=1 Tax=Anthurium amnicola TaxID=1678845 RepID=A0A1D1Z5I2_9ARAE